MREAEDSIDDDIRAAFAEASGGDEAVTTSPSEVAEPVAEGQPEVSAETPDGPVRDEKGRFAAKAQEEPEKPLAKAEQEVQSPPQPELAPGPPEETTAPPYSLKAALKAKWAELPPDVRDEFVRIETETHKAKTEWQSKAERLNRFEALFTPEDRNRLVLNRTDEFGYIQGLKAADEMLRGPNAFDALQQIAGMYGISLPQAQAAPMAADLAHQFDPGRPQQLDPASLQALLTPVVQPLMQRLDGLERSFTDRATADENAERQRADDRIAAFRDERNPDGTLKHLYFDNVRPLMHSLLQSGTAQDLEDAYEMAAYATPEVRKLLQAQAQAPATPQPRPPAPPKPAGLSVTGPPTPGAQPDRAGNSNSHEDDVRTAIRELAGGV